MRDRAARRWRRCGGSPRRDRTSTPSRSGPSCATGSRVAELLRRHELGDRHVERDRDPVGGVDPDAHRLRAAPPALAVAIQMPRAVHAHVRAQDQIAAEHDQQMLAGGLALLDGAAGDRRVDVDAIEVRVRGVEPRHDVAGEDAVQRPRRAEYRVALQASSALRRQPVARPGASAAAAARAAAGPSRSRRIRLRSGTGST